MNPDYINDETVQLAEVEMNRFHSDYSDFVTHIVCKDHVVESEFAKTTSLTYPKLHGEVRRMLVTYSPQYALIVLIPSKLYFFR